MFKNYETATHSMKQAVLSRVQAQFFRNGFFLSINPSMKYVRKKNNYIADALFRSFVPRGELHMIGYVEAEK